MNKARFLVTAMAMTVVAAVGIAVVQQQTASSPEPGISRTLARERAERISALVYDLIRKPVEEVTIEQFAGGRPVFVVQHEELAFEPTKVIERARSRLGENQYRLLSNNCEHFVEWCLYDVQRSFQVERALNFPRFMGERIQATAARFLGRVLTRLMGKQQVRVRKH
jgi:hypothetical protein